MKQLETFEIFLREYFLRGLTFGRYTDDWNSPSLLSLAFAGLVTCLREASLLPSRWGSVIKSSFLPPSGECSPPNWHRRADELTNPVFV